ncbi:integrase catalytic domain-containing protein [Nephila pilipes]|uniref:Integrase catalytic domain-containing protein n=1 Tax=Nephila pilipes TaxID=299642 RepID=A0A8X6T7M9_NEPPI|nr:integrase catalytic domain-containing protein [Nephila pilipes]
MHLVHATSVPYLLSVSCPFSEQDGVVHLAKIRKKHGDLLQPIQRLYPLEVSSPIDKDLRQQIESDFKHDERNISSDSLPLVSDSGEGLPPTSVHHQINRYGRTLRAPRRMDL